MRITGGQWRGRLIAVPKTGDIRPTQDRVREALFSMLMNDIAHARVLDLCAGCGSFGLEALSRGAAHATFVDTNARHVACARANFETLAGPGDKDRAVFCRADAKAFLARPVREGFDIIFADPPYALWDEPGQAFADWLALARLTRTLRDGGFFIAEAAEKSPAATADGFTLLRDRLYGKTRVLVWQLDGTRTDLL